MTCVFEVSLLRQGGSEFFFGPDSDKIRHPGIQLIVMSTAEGDVSLFIKQIVELGVCRRQTEDAVVDGRKGYINDACPVRRPGGSRNTGEFDAALAIVDGQALRTERRVTILTVRLREQDLLIAGCVAEGCSIRTFTPTSR